jgi:hypothetical protein
MSGSPQLSQDSPLLVHAHQLVQLDQLMADGRGDSIEADALRDQMDESWYRMTPSELEIARQVSADLYTLHDDPLIPHPQDFKVYSPTLAADLSNSISNGEFLHALQLMQARSSEISAERAALFRAILYRALGVPEVARKFFEKVAPPTNELKTGGIPLMGFLWQHMNVDAAVVAAGTGQFTSLPD